MGTLSDELAPHAARIANQPRVYVDANLPAGLVAFMRSELKWDVLFVIEHDDLRRARDEDHYVMARQLRRTLITLDRDYLDDRRFPPAESGGVLVLAAPDERGFRGLLNAAGPGGVPRADRRRRLASPAGRTQAAPARGLAGHPHRMIVLAGGDLVLPDRIIPPGPSSSTASTSPRSISVPGWIPRARGSST